MRAENLTTNCDWALYYRSIGWSPFPVQSGDKTPLIKWARHQTKIASEQEIRSWWRKYPDASIGIATGKVSGIVVVDVEAGGSTKDLPPTVVSRTGGGGYHYFYKHPGVVVKNSTRIRELTDIRGDGGYVVAAPSLHKSGNKYEWLVVPGDAELAGCPRWVWERPAEAQAIKTDWNKFLATTNAEGTRNHQAASFAGKILYHNPIEMWDTIGWTAMREWNGTHNSPPLPESELRATWESIKKTEIQRRNALTTPVISTLPPTTYAFTSLASLLEEPEEDIAWILDGILPSSGFSMVAAKPKAGKSTLARQLALATACGSPFLERQTTKGVVLYVALEEKRSEVKKHFKLMGGTGSEDLHLYVGSVPQEAHKWLEKEIRLRKPLLVIVDTLFRFVNITDGNDYSKVTAALSPILALARENGAHLMVIHHAGKGGGRDSGDSILGSTALFASVDTAIILKRTESRRTIETLQRYGTDLEPTVLTFDEGTRTTTLGGTKEEDDLQQVEDEILSFLGAQAESCNEKTIEDGVEGRTRLKRNALRHLLAKGSVYRTGTGHKGDAFLYACSRVPDIYVEQEKQEIPTIVDGAGTD